MKITYGGGTKVLVLECEMGNVVNSSRFVIILQS